MNLAVPEPPTARLAVALLPVVLVLGLVPLLAVTISPLHDYPFQLAHAEAVVVLGAGLLVLRLIVLAPAMLVPLRLLGITYLVVPHNLFGSLYGDARMPVTIARGWQAMAPIHDSHVAAFAQLPEGSRLWAATVGLYSTLAWHDAAALSMWHPPLKHVASLAGLGRDVFVVSTWADPATQPIVLPPEHIQAKLVQRDNPIRTSTAATLEQELRSIRRIRQLDAPADFLLPSYPDRLPGALPAGLAAVAEGPHFDLPRIE